MLCGTFAGILINEAASGMKNIITSLTFHHGALFPFLYKKKKNILKTEKKQNIWLITAKQKTQVRLITLITALLHSGHSATITVISHTPCVSCLVWLRYFFIFGATKLVVLNERGGSLHEWPQNEEMYPPRDFPSCESVRHWLILRRGRDIISFLWA